MDESGGDSAATIPRGFKLGDALWPGCIIGEDGLRELKHFPLLKDDVVIVSYPKSGTTWLSEIVSAIMNDGDMTKLTEHTLHVRVRWLEVEAGHWKTGVTAYMFLAFRWFYRLVGWRNTPTGREPRTFFTHVPFQLLPQKIIDGHCKVIYVARNPKDVLVSFYHYYKIARYVGQRKTLTWNTFYDWFCKGEVYSGSWFTHVKLYWNMCESDPHNCLFITYEQMKMDPFAAVTLIANFLNKKLSPDIISKIVKHTGFDDMKNNWWTRRSGYGMVNETNNISFYRKGDVGDWKNNFTESQCQHFDSLCEENLKGYEDLKKLLCI